MSKRSTSCGWQVNKTIIECNRHMLRNRICADVCLEVGKPDAKKSTRFYAHQYVLVSRSPVFQALFSKEKHGPGSKDEIPITRINDVTPSALEAILKYLYCEEVTIDECSVFSVLAAAKKFRVASLVTICYDFLESHLSVKTSCEFLQRASIFTGDPFIMQCLHYIWNHAEKVLDSSSFTKLSEQMLKAIVSSDYVAIPETHIFKAVVRWAERQCTMHGLKPTPDSLRRCLGDLIYTIRFPLMDPSEFANLVGQSGLLTNEEMSDIYTQILTTGDPRRQQSRFLRNPRTPKSVLTRFSLAVKRAPGDNQGDLADDAITFNTDHDILLCGIGIYGADTPGRIQIHLQLFVNDREPMSLATDLTVECDGRPEPYELAMPVPVYMKKLQPYTVLISIMGDMTYCGHRGVGRVSCGGVTFCFSKSGLSGNNTSVEMGQIPQLIFYKSPS